LGPFPPHTDLIFRSTGKGRRRVKYFLPSALGLRGVMTLEEGDEGQANQDELEREGEDGHLVLDDLKQLFRVDHLLLLSDYYYSGCRRREGRE
jgi:hypothetical protein